MGYNTFEFDAELKTSTDDAYLFVIDGRDVWVPISICVWTPESEDEVVGTVSLPRWFAERENLA